MNIAIIPARGGSKRIPRKNIKEFAGKPMISYAIAAAAECDIFDHIIVSTDDSEIADIAKSYGAEVPFERPADLADDHTPTVPVVAHAISECTSMGWQIDLACCIYPGVPLIQSEDIIKALEQIRSTNNIAFSFPVAPFPSAIQRALRRDATGMTRPFSPEHVNTRTQDLEAAYFDVGQFYWGTPQAWTAGLAIHSNSSTITIPEWRVVDIDTPEDWHRAELMYTALHQTSAK